MMNILTDLGLDQNNKLWVRDGEGQKYYLVVTSLSAGGIPVLGLVKADDEMTVQPTLENMPVHAEIQ